MVFLLLFVYVFGGTMGAGLEGLGSGDYLQYVVPGVLLLTLAAGVTGPAVSVSKDMTEGIVARFRTMDISRSAVLTGHVLGNLVQQVLALGIVLGIALLMGFRAPANVWGWLGAAGFLALVGFALCWLGAAFGVFAKGVESASNLPTPLLILPFLGSAFVPTDSMPTWLQWFAEYQPLHAVHRDPASAAVRDATGRERLAQPRLDRRDRRRRVAVGAHPLRAQVAAESAGRSTARRGQARARASSSATHASIAHFTRAVYFETPGEGGGVAEGLLVERRSCRASAAPRGSRR